MGASGQRATGASLSCAASGSTVARGAPARGPDALVEILPVAFYLTLGPSPHMLSSWGTASEEASRDKWGGFISAFAASSTIIDATRRTDSLC